MENSWTTFFPFATGELLAIDGPLWYNGSGAVVENSGGTLEINIAMPAVNLFGYSIPQLKASFRIGVEKEGPGNYGRATMNDRVIEDVNIDVSSLERSAKRIVDFSKDFHGEPLHLVVQKIGDRRARLTIQAHDFIVTRAG